MPSLRPLSMVLLLVAGCAPHGPIRLSDAQLAARASRHLPAAFDEVFEATWLTLEALGWTVTSHDRQAGTLGTNVVLGEKGLGRAWAATVSQEGAEQVVTLLPRLFEGEREVTGEVYWTLEGQGGEGQRWDALFTRIGSLLEAWRRHPELDLSNQRGEVDAAGLRLLLPETWKHFEFSTDRRTLAVQRQKQHPGLNPTLLYRIERRRPEPSLEPLVREALERAFHAPGKLVEPQWQTASDAWGVRGEGEALVGPVSHPVRWRRWEARSPAWVVRVAAACAPLGEAACDGEVHAVLESAADASGRLVNAGGAVPVFKAR